MHGWILYRHQHTSIVQFNKLVKSYVGGRVLVGHLELEVMRKKVHLLQLKVWDSIELQQRFPLGQNILVFFLTIAMHRVGEGTHMDNWAWVTKQVITPQF